MKEEETEVKGAFVDSLKRNNKQIRNDRAESIVENAQMSYRREIEDMEMSIKRMRREQENMLDLSPDSAHSLILDKNFDAKTYVEMDTKLSMDIRNADIKLELATNRYTYLFGGV